MSDPVGAFDEVYHTVTDYLSIPRNIRKDEQGTCVTVLGIQIDSIAMEASLPQEKLCRATLDAAAALKAASLTLKQTESLTGLLAFCSRVVRLGRTRLQSLYTFQAAFPRGKSACCHIPYEHHASIHRCLHYRPGALLLLIEVYIRLLAGPLSPASCMQCCLIGPCSRRTRAHQYQRITRVALDQDLEMALEELRKICKDEKAQPLTYNHYYTDTVQRAREDSMRSEVKQAIKKISAEWGHMHISNTLTDRDRLLSALQTRFQVDMSRQACEEASTGLHAYYKVARKTFVDNVARQVIERNMVEHLPTVFDPTTVLRLTDEEVQCIAGEPESKQERRKELRNLVAMMHGP